MVLMTLPVTVKSRKLSAKAKEPFKITATRPNDRYKVEKSSKYEKEPRSKKCRGGRQHLEIGKYSML